jgi:hypothetical protein
MTLGDAGLGTGTETELAWFSQAVATANHLGFGGSRPRSPQSLYLASVSRAPRCEPRRATRHDLQVGAPTRDKVMQTPRILSL